MAAAGSTTDVNAPAFGLPSQLSRDADEGVKSKPKTKKSLYSDAVVLNLHYAFNPDFRENAKSLNKAFIPHVQSHLDDWNEDKEDILDYHKKWLTIVNTFLQTSLESRESIKTLVNRVYTYHQKNKCGWREAWLDIIDKQQKDIAGDILSAKKEVIAKRRKLLEALKNNN